LNVNGSARTALITGAASGIGYELALLFARDGYHSILVARSREKLEQLAERLRRDQGAAATVVATDLAEAGAANRIFAELTTQGVQVDVLVNNASFTVYGGFIETSLASELEMMQLNMVALTQLTKLSLKGMVDRGAGRILTSRRRRRSSRGRGWPCTTPARQGQAPEYSSPAGSGQQTGRGSASGLAPEVSVTAH